MYEFSLMYMVQLIVLIEAIYGDASHGAGTSDVYYLGKFQRRHFYASRITHSPAMESW